MRSHKFLLQPEATKIRLSDDATRRHALLETHEFYKRKMARFQRKGGGEEEGEEEGGEEEEGEGEEEEEEFFPAF
jgi:hypothetical protein